MKALFYGGAISSMAGLVMGMGMALPQEPPPSGADVQPVAQLFASNASDASVESVSYGPAGVDALPPAYVVDTAYSPEPAYDLRPAADVSYEEPAIDRVMKTAWTETPEPKAAPQDVAAAGDTTAAEPVAKPDEPAQLRTFASIDAVLASTQSGQAGPS